MPEPSLGRTNEKAEACANKTTSTDPVNFIASFFLFVVVGSLLGRCPRRSHRQMRAPLVATCTAKAPKTRHLIY